MTRITDYAAAKSQVSVNYLKRRGQEIYEGALAIAATGATLSQICTALKISPSTLAAIRRDDPEFSQRLRDAQEQASAIVLDELREVPYSEIEPARARVKIDAIKSYLALKWPHLYGNRLDITVKTLDMGKALELARQRARERRQPIDVTAQVERLSTDSLSVDDPETLDPAFLALLE